ncbi:MAG: TldD/PmbA family protein [Candidatus Bathyarchaeia archaeon]
MDFSDLANVAVDASTRLGADYSEARVHVSSYKGYVMKNGEEDPLRLSSERGISVRVIVDGALGFASTNTLLKVEVQRVAAEAVKAAKASSKHVKERIVFSKENQYRGRWEAPMKKPPDSLPLDSKFALLAEVEDWISPDNVKTDVPYRLFVLTEATEEKVFVNCEGSEIYSIVPRIGFYFTLTAHEAGKGTAQRMMEFGSACGWEVLSEWRIHEVIQGEALTLGRILREAEQPPRGEVDLVLGSEIVGIICHESCGHPQEADRILGREMAQAGGSYLKAEMIGKRIGSEAVTVVDDPTLPKSYGYYLYDDEGVKASERVLIDKGVIRGFLHNRETAYKLGTRSNGAARAVAYDREPIVRMANTYMKPGDYSFEELIADVSEGVYVKSFTEWNIDDRRFNQRYVGLEAYKIKGGELTGLVKNPILEITTPGLYGSVDAVGRIVSFEAATCGKGEPMQPAPVWHGGPEIRLRKIKLGG